MAGIFIGSFIAAAPLAVSSRSDYKRQIEARHKSNRDNANTNHQKTGPSSLADGVDADEVDIVDADSAFGDDDTSFAFKP